jgi:hypothetical protein
VGAAPGPAASRAGDAGAGAVGAARRGAARRGDQRTYGDEDEAKIRELIKSRPDATLAEVAEALAKPASLATVSRTLGRLDLPRKKSPPTRRSGSGPT